MLLREAGKPEISGISGSAAKFVQKAATILGLEDINDGKAVFEVINKNSDEIIRKLFEDFCMEIAHIISNLQVILDLDRVLIGGGISEQPIVLDEIRKQYGYIRERTFFLKRSFVSVPMNICKFRSNANLLGAAYQYFLNETH